MSIAVSIIVPIYNTEKYLYRCIDSILLQTFINFECILVVDASPDNCIMICNEYAKKDARIKIVCNKKNMGLPLTRREGLKIASGEYILHVDSDDYIERDMLEKLYNKAISENYDMVICDYFYEKNGIKEIIKQNITDFNKTDMIKNIIAIKIKTVVWNKLVKKELNSLVDFSEYSRSEDYVISIQNVYNADKIGYIDIPLYNYCYNDASLSNNIEVEVKGRIEENRNWRKIISFLKEKYGSLTVFEPELSKRVNKLKDIYTGDKELKSIKELFSLYPESRYLKWRIIKNIKKINKNILPYPLWVYLKKQLKNNEKNK